MKNTIKKQILLFSAFAMLLSTVPMQAEVAVVEEEMVAAPADVQQEVAVKRGFFSGWTPSALQRRMRTAMRDLDREWKPFIKCVKEGKGGCFQQAKTVRNLIGTILALIGVTATGIFVARRGRQTVGAEEQISKVPRGMLRRAEEMRAKMEAPKRSVPPSTAVPKGMLQRAEEMHGKREEGRYQEY